MSKIEGPTHDIATRVVQYQIGTAKDGNTILYKTTLEGGIAADGTQYPAKEYVSFDQAIGNKAHALTPAPGQPGQQVTARVRITQSPKRDGGFWINYDLLDISADALPGMAMPAQPGTEAQPQMPLQAPENTPAPHAHPMLASEAQQDIELRRRSAMHAAIEFAGRIYQGHGPEHGADAVRVATVLAKQLEQFAATGTFEEIPGANPTPQEIAESVNAASGEGTAVVTAGPGLPWTQQ